MDNIINIFKSTFLFKEDVDTDNLVFKIITKISVGICVSCALLVAATQGNIVYTKKKMFFKRLLNRNFFHGLGISESIQFFCWIYINCVKRKSHIKSENTKI